MTNCGICSGLLRTDESVYTVIKNDGTKVNNVCSSCVNKYCKSNER
jgi:hypothetical protein